MRACATLATLVAGAALVLASSSSPTSLGAAARPRASPAAAAAPNARRLAGQHAGSTVAYVVAADPAAPMPLAASRPSANSRSNARVVEVYEHRALPDYVDFSPAAATQHSSLMGDALFALPPPPECPPCNPFNCVLPAFGCLNNGASALSSLFSPRSWT